MHLWQKNLTICKKTLKSKWNQRKVIFDVFRLYLKKNFVCAEKQKHTHLFTVSIRQPSIATFAPNVTNKTLQNVKSALEKRFSAFYRKTSFDVFSAFTCIYTRQ